MLQPKQHISRLNIEAGMRIQLPFSKPYNTQIYKNLKQYHSSSHYIFLIIYVYFSCDYVINVNT